MSDNYVIVTRPSVSTQSLVKSADTVSLNATLIGISAVTATADQIIYATGVNAFDVTTLTEYARSLLSKEDATSILGLLGVLTLLNNKADINSPIFTGTPTVPTADLGTLTTQAASTEFVIYQIMDAIAELVDSSPATLNTLAEIATALGNDENFATTITNLLAEKISSASNAGTGVSMFYQKTGVDLEFNSLLSDTLDITDNADGTVSIEVNETAEAVRVTEIIGSKSAISINEQTASYTLALTDIGKVVAMNSASATTLTIPNASTVDIDVLETLAIRRMGAGTVTFTAESGVTIYPTGTVTIAAQYATASLHHIAENVWLIDGYVEVT